MIHKELYTLFNHFLSSLFSFLFEKDTVVKSIEEMDSTMFKKCALRSSSCERALFSYGDPLVKTLIWNIKFRRNKKCIALAGALLYEEVTRLRYEKLLLIPVPISGRRKQERGYNQTECLVDEIKTYDKANVLEIGKYCLTKKHVSTQTSLSRIERIQNLKGSFTVSDPLLVSGRNIVIIDDVITTGATMDEISHELEAAGARHIIMIAFAH